MRQAAPRFTGGHNPTCPYTKNDEGHGPAWANSLFEDNAEFGYGMNLALTQRRAKLIQLAEEAAKSCKDGEVKDALSAWLEGKDNAEQSKAAAAKLNEVLSKNMDKSGCKDKLEEIMSYNDLFVKKSVWIFGGRRLGIRYRLRRT